MKPMESVVLHAPGSVCVCVCLCMRAHVYEQAYTVETVW